MSRSFLMFGSRVMVNNSQIIRQTIFLNHVRSFQTTENVHLYKKPSSIFTQKDFDKVNRQKFKNWETDLKKGVNNPLENAVNNFGKFIKAAGYGFITATIACIMYGKVQF